MKKVLFPLLIVLLSGLIYLNYLAYNSPKEDKIISQATTYSLTELDQLNLKLYANRKTAFQEKEAINNLFLHNVEQTKKLTVEIVEIKKLQNYSYLSDKYTCYSYLLELPSLDTHFFINEAYLTIRLKNGHECSLFIGSFDYYRKSSNLDLVELYGTRHPDFPALDSVSFKFNLAEEIFLDHLFISNKVRVYLGKSLASDELLTVILPAQNQISDCLVLKLVYQQNGQLLTEHLPYYLYYETWENPLNYGLINYVYLLS